MPIALGDEILAGVEGTGPDTEPPFGETIEVMDAAIPLPGWRARSLARLQSTALFTGSYNRQLSDLLRLRDRVRVGLVAAAEEVLDLSVEEVVRLGFVLRNRLTAAETVAPAMRRSTTLESLMTLADAARRAESAAVADELALEAQGVHWLRAVAAAADVLELLPDAAPRLLIGVTARVDVEFTLTEMVQQLLNPSLSDVIEFSGAMVSPGDVHAVWSMNVRNAAVTEYSNYAFNSFARDGQRFYAASEDGLYELHGDDDDGASIEARIASGFQQFTGSNLGSFAAAYIAMRGSGQVIFRLETADGRQYDYEVQVRDSETTKVRLGKGLRTRYLAFELITTGEDFDLDDVEFIPLGAQRRI